MSSFKPMSGQFPDLCSNDTFSSPSRFQRVVLLLVSFWGCVHLAGLREELFNRVEQLVYIEGFSDTGEVTFLKRLCGQVGAHDDGGNVCEVCDGMQAVIEGDAVHARELVVHQEQTRFQVMYHLERLETVRHE